MVNTKYSSTFFILFIIIFHNCKNKEQQTIKKNINSSLKTIIKKKEPSLYIEGNNIWVRDLPKRGKVIMKLNEGDKCVLLDTSKVDTIKGQIDFWYQIKYKNTIGWVYGAQTNIKSKSSIENQLFIKQAQKFIEGFNKKDFNLLNSFIDPENPMFCVLSNHPQNSEYKISSNFKELLNYEKTVRSFSNLDGLLKSLAKYSEIKISYKEIINPYHYNHSNAYYTLIPEKNKKLIENKNFSSNKVELFFFNIKNRNKHPLSSYLQFHFSHNYKNPHLKKEVINLKRKEKNTVFELLITSSNMGSFCDIPAFYFYLKNKKWYLLGFMFMDEGG